jgi:hypothetical protein
MSHPLPVSPSRARRRRPSALPPILLAFVAVVLLAPAVAQAQVTAVVRPGATPAWSQGMRAVDSESYYHAIECGKQGGEDPPCVFWDTGICKNDDFTLTFYSGYKQVAYTVWTAVRKKQPAPQPNYQAARQVRVTIGIAPAPGSKNRLTDFVVKRGGTPVRSTVRDVANGGGQFTYDYAPWAPTSPVTIEMVGKTRTVSCVIPAPVLASFR